MAENNWSDAEWARVEDVAKVLGYGRGSDAGAWVTDGNTSQETFRALLAGVTDGDPAVLDALPILDLSGEWADGPHSPTICLEIAAEAGVTYDVAHAERWDEVLDYYRDAFDDGVVTEVERACREALS